MACLWSMMFGASAMKTRMAGGDSSGFARLGWLKWMGDGIPEPGPGLLMETMNQHLYNRLCMWLGLPHSTVASVSKTSYPAKVTASRASVPENKTEAAWILWLGFRSYIVSLLPYSTGWSYHKPAQTQGKGTETLISMKILSKNVRQYFKTAT